MPAANLNEFLDGLLSIVPVVCPPAIGGAVAYLNQANGRFSVKSLVLGMVTAGFVGWIVYLILQTTSFHPALKSAVVGMSGYSSRDMLNLMKRRLLKAAEKEGL